MKNAAFILAVISLIRLSSAFSILGYENEVTVNQDGGISVYERMTFDLEREYSEGFRSIRKEDFGSLSDINVESVMVNGAPEPYDVVMNADQAEIIWKKTHVGQNIVELRYRIADRVQLFNDFARLCYEHYGANWPADAGQFTAKTSLPPEAAGKPVHFEVYSFLQGDARLDGLDVIIDMEGVPSGNYVGGCYLFDRESVLTNNTVNESAFEILQSERDFYGSEPIAFGEDEPMTHCCCFPMFLLSLVSAAVLSLRELRRPKETETILPPGKEEPAVVSALVRNKYEIKELVAATIVDLINRGVIDIVELEKAGAKPGTEISRERTILMLRKRPADLKDYENSVLDLFFADEKEVDLDAMISKYKTVQSQTVANQLPIVARVAKFNVDFRDQVDSMLAKDAEVERLSKSSEFRSTALPFLGIVALLFIGFISCALIETDMQWYSQHGEEILLYSIFASAFGFAALAPLAAYLYLKPEVPKGSHNLELYKRWDAFFRGLKASMIREYPPSSAVIWGDILKYATALGLADKVKSHLSELDSALAERVRAVDGVAIASMAYYSGSLGVYNLGTFGNRSGYVSSSGPSGGWSSGGGGGFSGGSSGGGGFR